MAGILFVVITLLNFQRLIYHTLFFNIPFIMTRILSVAITLLHFQRLISHTPFSRSLFPIMTRILSVAITLLHFQRLISHTSFSRNFFPIMTRILSVAIDFYKKKITAIEAVIIFTLFFSHDHRLFFSQNMTSIFHRNFFQLSFA